MLNLQQDSSSLEQRVVKISQSVGVGYWPNVCKMIENYVISGLRTSQCLLLLILPSKRACKNKNQNCHYFLIPKAIISSNRVTVSAGLAIQAVVHADLALKSFPPPLRNWSPTCNVFAPFTPPNHFWQPCTPW